MNRLTVTTLGTFTATLDKKPIKGFRSAKIQALLAYLLIERERAQRRETLIDLLWSDQDPKAANANFRQSLSRLQRALKNKETKPPFLIVTRKTVQWNDASHFQFDVAQLSAELKTSVSPTLLDLYTGDFLSGFFVADAPNFDNWVATVRENLHQQTMAGISNLIEQAAQTGNFTLMEQAARRQLALSPWDEAAHRHLMQALAMQGQRNAALAQFDRCFEVLQAELGIEPSSETEALYEQIATGVVVAEIEDARRLPKPVTPFIGRIAEISHIINTIFQTDCRLLTLTGAGGIGKTRLALEVAHQISDRLDQRVVYVSLIGIANITQALAALARAFGLTVFDPEQVEQQLRAAFGSRPSLIVFDNAEALVAADGPAVTAWLDSLFTRNLHCRVLATSRQPLQSQAEWILPVEGLAMPQIYSAENLTPDQWDQFDALALLQQRAKVARVTFNLTTGNIADAVRLCQLVEGSPLGIKLAAAQISRLTLAELVNNIKRQPDLLEVDLRDFPLRHRKLRTVFEDSWRLLNENQQTTLTTVAIFQGGFTRAAARAVLGEGADSLDTLVERGLLTRHETTNALTRMRYRLASALQAWLLAKGTNIVAKRDLHATYFLKWAVDHEAQQETERNNLLAALTWVQTQPNLRVPIGWQPRWAKALSTITLPPPPVPTRKKRIDLVGREAEMATLRDAIRPILYKQTPQNGGLVTILGEAGIGKSYLVTRLRAEFPRITWFDCPNNETSARGLGPFRRWLRIYFRQQLNATFEENLQAFGARFDDIVQATPDPEVAKELDRLHSLLAALVDLILPDTLYSRLRPEQRRENFQLSIKTLIKAESLLRPVVVHLEDGHWLDEESGQLLISLLRYVESFPFAVIVTARPSGFTLPDLLNVPQRMLRLDPFSAESIIALTTAHLGQPPDTALLAWLRRRGAGNPFFTGQLLHYLSDYGLVANGKLVYTNKTLTDSRLPLDIHNVLAARIGHLAPEVREVVSQASVLGKEFSLPVLREVVRSDEILQKALKIGETAAIWQQTSAERYIFNHALLHDTAYKIQFDVERQALHNQAAQAVAAVATQARPQYAAIAQHYDVAAQKQKAAAYYLKAGDEAQNNYFIREAHSYYSRGLALAETDEQRLRLLLGRESINHWLGNREQQQEDLRQLTGISAESAERTLHADIALRRATFALVTGEYDQSIQFAQQAVKLVASVDRALEAKAMHRWARALWQQGKPRSAERILRRALKLTELTNAIEVQAKCHYDLGVLAFFRDEYTITREQLAQAIPLFEQQVDQHNVARCVDLLGVVAYQNGYYEEALERFQKAIALSRQIDWRYGEISFISHVGTCYYDLGLYDLSKQYHLQAVTLSRNLDEREFEAQSHDELGLVYQSEGDLHTAKQYFEQAKALANAINHVELQAYALTHLGIVMTNLEDLEGASSALYEAIALHGETQAHRTEINTLTALAWLDMAQGDTYFAAERVREVLEQFAEKSIKGVERPLFVYWQCYTVLQAAGEQEEAYETLQTAYQILQKKAQFIKDDALRHGFLTNIPWHHQINEQWRSTLASGSL